MGRQSNTKEQLILEGMKLFGERGYDAVKITDIAKEIGCAPSAMYKHFENKEKLYEAILDQSREHFEENKQQFTIDLTNPMDRDRLLKMSREEFINWVMDPFDDALNNIGIKYFRRLMMIEQFHNEELAAMYNERYIIAYYRAIKDVFELFMENGKMVKGKSDHLAIMFSAPFNVAVGLIDRTPESADKVLAGVEKHVRDFCDEYFI